MPLDETRRLLEILLKKSVRFGDFTLASGERSDVYIDCKPTTCLAEAMPLIGRAFLKKMLDRGWKPDAVGGLTFGADPIAMATARESLHSERAVNAFIVRKERKSHGMGKVVEGLELTQGCPVVIIEDVCTTGGSTELAIKNARSEGMVILGAICLVDREQGAGKLLAQHGCDLERIFTLSELRAAHAESQHTVVSGR